MNLITESGSQVIMRALKVVREAGVRWVVAQGGLEPVGRRPPLRDEPANRYPVARDDDGLTMLDRVEDVGEAPCRLRGSDCDHEYTLSDLICLYVYERQEPLHAVTGSWTAGNLVVEAARGLVARMSVPVDTRAAPFPGPVPDFGDHSARCPCRGPPAR